MSDQRGYWTRFLDESSQKYYYHNSQTDVTTWDAPEEFAVESSSSTAPVWQEYFTEDDKRYFYNSRTNQTQWDPPAEGFLPAVSSASSSSSALPLEPLTDADLEREVFADLGGTGESYGVAFKKMIFDLKLPDGMTWTETMEQHGQTLASDARFASVAAHKRAILFAEMQIARRAARIRREEKARRVAAEQFVAELRRTAASGTGVEPGTPFEAAEQRFGGAEWWRRVGDVERRELYEEWDWTQQTAQVARDEKAAAEAAETLKEELRSTVKSETFSFASFNTLFEKSKAYQTLSRKQRIELFSAHIRALEETAQKNELEEKKHKHWGSLTAREALQVALRKLADSGAVHYASTWAEIRDKHLSDPVTGRPGELLSRLTDASYVGSSPRDLTEAFLETLRPQFDQWKRAAPAMIGAVVPISLQQFTQHLESCETWPILEKKPHFIPVLYEERRNEIEIEKKRKALRELFDSSKIRRSERDWSQVKRKISHRSAFSNLSEEDARKTWELWCREESPDASSMFSSSSMVKKRERENGGDDDTMMQTGEKRAAEERKRGRHKRREGEAFLF